GPRTQPAGGSHPTRTRTFKAGGPSESPCRQGRRGRSLLAPVRGPPRRTQGEGRRTPSGPAVVRIGAFRLVRQAGGRTEAARSNARRSGSPSPTSGTARGRVPASHVGRGGSGEGRETPDRRSRKPASSVGETPIGGGQSGTSSTGPIGPAPGEVPRSRREGDRNQGGHPGSGGTSGSDERSGERGRDGFGGTADSEGDDRSGVLADREPFRPVGDAAEGP